MKNIGNQGAFRLFLKEQNPAKVDRIVRALDPKIKASVDCLECGMCCHILEIPMADNDIVRIASLSKVSKETYMQNNIKFDKDDGLYYMKATPCRFLDGNFCTIYESRPTACRAFPFTDKPDFTSRTIMMMENAEFCPIVEKLLDELKFALGYDD